MDLAIFILGLVIALIPLVILPKALKEAKGGEPAKTVLRDENGHVVGSVDTVTEKKPLYKTEMGKWYIAAQLLAGGFGVWMMIDSFA